MNNVEEVKEKIKLIHTNDEEQTNVIFDDAAKIIVEAPAGCGKTKTMISKIAYILASNSLEANKKILALTFSVNASYKIKKDVLEQLPNILDCSQNESINLSSKIIVSNYHGFCRKILSKYGHLILNGATDFNSIKAIGSNRRVLNGIGVNNDKINQIMAFSEKIKRNNLINIYEECKTYNNFIKQDLINNNIVTYDGLLSLTYELLREHQAVKEFYSMYYPIIFVDEFQDTNCISWSIIKELLSDNSKAIFMGDPLQRIYGFIGAIPNLMKKAEIELNMRKYDLNTNYRFKDNPDMLFLDKNVRFNSEQINSPKITVNSNPVIVVTDNQDVESTWICQKAVELSIEGKVAILTRNGMVSRNTQKIKEALDNAGIRYFFGLFTDEDENYINFHIKALEEFELLVGDKGVITKRISDKLILKMQAIYANGDNVYLSLLKLLSVFLDKIFNEYAMFLPEEKVFLIRETFENKALRQNMDKIDESIILSTIHASKGLEFLNVIIPDVETNSIPSVFICQNCNSQNFNSHCVKKYSSQNENEFLEELSVFYVGFTRAKNNVYFSLSKLDADGNTTKGSCFLKLKGIGRENLMKA